MGTAGSAQQEGKREDEQRAGDLDADALKAAVAEHHPGLVITDIRMPPTFTDEGLCAAVELRRSYPGLAVVVLSQYVQHRYAADLLDSGDGRGVGYLLKDRVADVEDFIATLRRVTAGGTVVDAQVISQLVPRGRDPLSACRRASARFSPSSPKDTPTPRSPGSSSSPRQLSASTSATSWPSSASPRPTTPTGASWRSWLT